MTENTVSAIPARIKRFEQKLLIQPQFQSFVQSWLSNNCILDPVFPGNPVYSVYFDTPDLRSYYECLDGDIYKNKVRLRWYELPGTGKPVTAYLEVKSKAGFGTDKYRSELRLEDSAMDWKKLAFLTRAISLDRILQDMGQPSVNQLAPTILITYQRRRFRESETGLSLTYDSGISSFPLKPDLPRHFSLVTLRPTVLELKGGSLTIPTSMKKLQYAQPRWSSFSKYAKCLQSHLEQPGSVDWDIE